MTSAIRLDKIGKRFGQVIANHDVSLTIKEREIFGLIGENGAGKSTLMKILYGFYQQDRGDVYVFDQLAMIRSPRDALDLGIGMVHQHFMAVERMSVCENMLLGCVEGFSLANSFRHANKRIQEISETYQLLVKPDDIVGDLSVGIRQRVEIIKALYRGARILILDEPTAVLTLQETDQFFKIIRKLQQEGVTCILITHKLREILELTDRVAVMRGGKIVAEHDTKDCDEVTLSTQIIGQAQIPISKAKKSPAKNVTFSVKDLGYTDQQNVVRLHDISFDLHKHEILGIAGVSGNGQSELLEICSGILQPSAGSLYVNGSEYDARHALSGLEARKIGIAHVPEDRTTMGIISDFPAYLNFLLGYQRLEYEEDKMLSLDKLRAACQQGMLRFNVQPNQNDLKAHSFSGGNQQKLILAREMHRQMPIVLAGQPTRGVDIGAISTIHNLLIEHRNQGGSILLVSSELDEILALSDRIIVMFEGGISGEVETKHADRRQLGRWMAGNYEKTRQVS